MIGVILLSIFFGIILTLFIQYFIFRYWLKSLPVVTDKWKSQSDPFVVPQELLKIVEHLKENQDKGNCCDSLNFVFQFLFQELKDADHVRKWAMKKLKNEFSELLQSTTGKLLDEIRIRGFNLGRTFPIIQNVSLVNADVNEDHTIDEVAILLDLTYNGRFQLAVDVGMVFGKSAYLSVTVTKLQGTARLQFSTVPYRHWSFAFIKDPILEFEVDSHFEGRPIARLTSIITNQIKRQVRKKHTLPNYKIRYKPFFVMPTQKVEPRDVFYRNLKLSIGRMNVVVVGCTRLLQTPPDSYIFCSLAIDSMHWSELMDIKKKSCSHFECELIKSSPQLGLIFEDEFLVEKFEEVVVVTSVSNGSPASKAGIHENDVIVSINGTKVASSKQAFRMIRQSAEKVVIRVERDVSGNSEVSQNSNQRKITKVPSMDSLSSLAKDLDVPKDISNLLKGSQESLVTPQSVLLNGSPQHGEGNQLKGSSLSVNVEAFPPPSSSSSLLLERKEKDRTPTKTMGMSEKDVYVENLLTYNPSKSEDLNIGELTNNGEAVIKKTRMFGSCQNPVFNQRFQFEVKEHHAYLNICVWCREVEKVDKQLKVTKVEKDTLLGHVSISLMDIALECSTTLQGDFTNSFNLVPSQSKIGMGRQQYQAVSTHPGFEDRLCHGDVLLRFHYSREDETFQDNLDIFDNFHMEDTNSTVQTKTEKVSSNFHCFQPAQFQSAVHCKFCSKKIWFKSAFMCTTCKMVCHKKCIEKCQLQTTCTRAPRSGDVAGGGASGERKRHKSAPDDQKKAAETAGQPLPPEPDTLTRKSSSSSLKDLSANEASTDNSESSTGIKMAPFWKEESSDEKIVTAAKSVGKQLYNDLDIEMRKKKFDEVIITTQLEIERENKHQTELQNRDKKTVDKKVRMVLKDKIMNSEEKLKSLKVLMLQYCAGLQHCMDEEENLRQQRAMQLESINSAPDLMNIQESKLLAPDLTNMTIDDSEVGNKNVLNSDFEEDDKREEQQIEDFVVKNPSLLKTISSPVTCLLKDDEGIGSESGLAEVQALLASHHSSDTSSQKSLEIDTSPEDDYPSRPFGEFQDPNNKPLRTREDNSIESNDLAQNKDDLPVKSKDNNLDVYDADEEKRQDPDNDEDDTKVRFEL